MLKKSVITATVSAAVLSMSATAFAGSYDSYGSYNSAPAFNATSDAGFVIGVQGGYGNTHWDNVAGLGSSSIFSVKDTGFAARGFVGYDFNKCFGLELGYTHLPTTKITWSIPDTSGTLNISSYGIDLLGKISLPVTPVFKIYAKAGLGYLHASSSGLDNFDGDNNGSGSSKHLGPAYGVGASYEIIPNLAIDATWLRYSGQNNQNSSNYIPDADVGLIGLSYKFPTQA